MRSDSEWSLLREILVLEGSYTFSEIKRLLGLAGVPSEFFAHLEQSLPQGTSKASLVSTAFARVQDELASDQQDTILGNLVKEVIIEQSIKSVNNLPRAAKRRIDQLMESLRVDGYEIAGEPWSGVATSVPPTASETALPIQHARDELLEARNRLSVSPRDAVAGAYSACESLLKAYVAARTGKEPPQGLPTLFKRSLDLIPADGGIAGRTDAVAERKLVSHLCNFLEEYYTWVNDTSTRHGSAEPVVIDRRDARFVVDFATSFFRWFADLVSDELH